MVTPLRHGRQKYVVVTTHIHLVGCERQARWPRTRKCLFPAVRALPPPEFRGSTSTSSFGAFQYGKDLTSVVTLGRG